MVELRRAIRAGERTPSVQRCVCSMYREPAELASLRAARGGTCPAGSESRLLGHAPAGPTREQGLKSGSGLGERHRVRLNRMAGAHRHQSVRLEHVHGTPLLVLPTVFNPRLLRTGAFFFSPLFS